MLRGMSAPPEGQESNTGGGGGGGGRTQTDELKAPEKVGFSMSLAGAASVKKKQQSRLSALPPGNAREGCEM